MQKTQAAIMAVGMGILLLLPLATAANAHGSGYRSHSFRLAHRRYGPYRGWLLYNGWVDFPPYVPDNFMSYPPPPTAFFLPGPLGGARCHRSQETVTVAAEEGGTRQVTITRCYP